MSLLSASLAFAGWTQQGDGTATFDARGPAGFKIHGENKKVSVTDDGKALKVSLNLKDVDTDNDLRNKHMLEDVGAEQFPTMSLSVPVEQLKAEDGKATSGEATGTVAMHGQTKQVTFKYTADCKAGVCAVDGTANLNLSDYGIKIRSYLGITVKPDIVVGAKFSVKK
ncbi:MAG: YceI family protein [Myxococcota bacterium]